MKAYVPWSRLSRFAGDGRPPSFNRNPYNGDINPYYWVDDHPLLYGNNGSLDPGTCTLSKTHSHFAPENMPAVPQKERIIFQPFIFRGELFGSGKVFTQQQWIMKVLKNQSGNSL